MMLVLPFFLVASRETVAAGIASKHSTAFLSVVVEKQLPVDFQQPAVCVENMLMAEAYNALRQVNYPAMQGTERIRILYVSIAPVAISGFPQAVCNNNQLRHIYPFHYFW